MVVDLAGQVIARARRLDVVILNARPHRELTGDGFEVDFATNHLSPFLLTQRLRDLLRASAPARIVTVSSSCNTCIAGGGFRGTLDQTHARG